MKRVFRNIAESVFYMDARVAFLALCFFSLTAIAFQQYFILTDEVYFNTLGEQMAYERIETMLDNQRKYAWLSYAIMPLLLIVQIFLITICLNIGTLLMEHPEKGGRGLNLPYRFSPDGLLRRRSAIVVPVGSIANFEKFFVIAFKITSISRCQIEMRRHRR